MTAARRIAAAAGAATALVVLVVAVPALLAQVGWPLPTTIPGPDTATAVRTGQGADTFFINTLAVAGWILWAQTVAAVVVEVVAAARGRLAPQIRGVASPIQAAAARAIAAIIIIGGTNSAALAAHATTPLAPAAIETTTETPADTAADTAADRPDPAAAAAVVGSTWQVQRNDTIWGIASRALGDPMRFTEIIDLNVGRPQPNGAAMAPDGDIDIGWTLQLPDSNPPPDPARPATPAGASVAQIVVEPGDSLWAIADSQLGDPTRWDDIYTTNQNRPQPDGTALTDPAILRPGWTLQLPDTNPQPDTGPADVELAPAESEPAVPVPTPGSVTETLPVDDTATRPDDPPPVAAPQPAAPDTAPAVVPAPASPAAGGDVGGDVVDPDLAVPVGLAAGGLATVGLVWTLRRLRRRQQRRRRAGQRLATVTGTAAATETVVTAGANLADGQRLVAALAAVSAGTRPDRPIGAIDFVSVSADGTIAIWPAQSRPAPDGFVADGPSWRVDVTDDELVAAGAGADAPLPALVSLGFNDDGDEILIDVEAVGVVAVDGHPDRALSLVRSLALSLATQPCADFGRVVIVGGPDNQLCALDGVEGVGTLSEALDIAETHVAARTGDLVALGAATGLDGRTGGVRVDSLTSLVVVTAAPDPDDIDLVRRLGRLGQQRHRCLGLIVSGTVTGAAFQLTVDDAGYATAAPIDTRLAVHQIDDQAETDIAQLISVAASEPTTPNAAAPARQPPTATPPDNTGDPADDDGDVVDLRDVAAPTDAAPTDAAPTDAAPTGTDGDRHTPPGNADRAGMPPVAEAESPAGPEARPAPVGLEVTILGRPAVIDLADGATVLGRGSKAFEAICYLATHTEPTPDQLTEALWPAQPAARNKLHVVLSRLRTKLAGTDPDGGPWLPDARHTNGTYRLSGHISTDYTRFCDLADAAADAPPDIAARLLTDALDLIDGPPFGVEDYPWTTGIAATIEAQIVDAAETLADLHAAAGEPVAAETAARAGLAASPYQDRLYVAIGRARYQQGNLAGVRAAYDELYEHLGEIHPDTIAAFETIIGPAAPTGPGDLAAV